MLTDKTKALEIGTYTCGGQVVMDCAAGGWQVGDGGDMTTEGAVY